ncbi:MAG: hypothetical protein IJ326_08375 [Lachnospiraceae bacterium]|nr:hypothetical protein [Lachnospiraceae bacterium]
MKIRKRKKQSIDDIRGKVFDFDFQKEKDIYDYLCFGKVKRKRKKYLNENTKFYYYRDWKLYVLNKYINYEEEKLMEFSRYLNLLIRKIKPGKAYWNISISVYLTLILTETLDWIKEIQNTMAEPVSIEIYIAVSIIGLGAFAFVFYMIYSLVTPIWKDSNTENFLKDYKEIIDEMMKEK